MGEIKLKPVVVYIPEDVDVASMTIVRTVMNEQEQYHNEIMTGCFTGRAEGFNIMSGDEYALTEDGKWVLMNPKEEFIEENTAEEE